MDGQRQALELDGGKISPYQLIILTVPTIAATGLLFLPSLTVALASRDAWVVPLLSSSFSLAALVPLAWLNRRFPGQTIIQYAPRVLGSVLGKVLGALVVLYLIHINAVITREFSEFVQTAIMPRTPPIALVVLGVFVAASAVRNGIEVLARVNEWVSPQLFILMFLAIVFVSKDMDVRRVLPFLEHGPGPVLRAALAVGIWFGEVFVLAFFFPNLNRPERGPRATAWGAAITALLMTGSSFVALAVLGDLTAHLEFPVYDMIRFIRAAEFVERIDALVVAFWLGAGMIKMAVFYYAAVLGLAQLLGLRDYHPLVLPVGALLAPASMWLFDSSVEMKSFMLGAGPIYFLGYELLVPWFLLLADAVFHRRPRTRG